MTKKCEICGAELPKRHQRYCSVACQRKAQSARKRNNTGRSNANPDMLWTSTCMDCGATFRRPIKCIRCAECQHKIKLKKWHEWKKNGSKRLLGSKDICKNCGAEYIVQSGMQRYCKNCAEAMMNKNIRAHKRAYAAGQRADPEKSAEIKYRKRLVPTPIICKWCGAEFYNSHGACYCSSECRKNGQKEYMRKYDAARRKKESKNKEQ